MKIGIIGGGAIGLLTAAYLCNRHDVTIYTRRLAQANLLNRENLRLVRHNGERTVPVRAVPLEEAQIDADVVFIAVKQYDLPHVLENSHRQWPPEATLVFLQNGMGHLRWLAELKQENIVVGIVEHGAFKQDDRTVVHTGIGKMMLSVFRGHFGLAKQLFHDPIPRFFIGCEHDWRDMMTKKLVVNAVVNPLTAVLRVRNGDLLRVGPYQEMMKLLFSEVRSALELNDGEAAWNHIVQICEKTAANRSSMLADVERGRKTEVDAILGYVIACGEERKVPTPLSRFLFHAVKGMEGRE
jgi:2-dehydropantoate 2-reductase